MNDDMPLSRFAGEIRAESLQRDRALNRTALDLRELIEFNMATVRLMRDLREALKLVEYIPDLRVRIDALAELTKAGVHATNLYCVVHGRPVISEAELIDDPD